MTTPDPTRSKAIEVMARGDADLLPQIMALVEEYATAKSIMTLKAERGTMDGYARVCGEASVAYRQIENVLNAFGEVHLAHLQAEGMTVVPVDGTARTAALEEAVAMAETFAESHRAPPHHNDTFWAAMNIAKAIRTLSASPYGKASMQEGSAEAQSAVANTPSMKAGKEESK